MIKESDLLEAISECQGERNPNANTCIKLAAYYTILDHITAQRVDEEPQYSFSYGDIIGKYGESEFLKSVEGKDAPYIWDIMDELMATLQIIEPRLYRATINKINN